MNKSLCKFQWVKRLSERWHIRYRDDGFDSHTQGSGAGWDSTHFITPAALYAIGERHLRRIMCVKSCDCNNCYKKKTCADCPYCFENKDVDCNTKGIQGCKYKIDYPESEDKKYCCTCKWYAEFEGVCCNADSKWTADFRCLDDSCDCWEDKDVKKVSEV